MEKSVCLTGREVQVLHLIARGCTYAKVADQLGMSTHTVGTHTSSTTIIFQRRA